MSDEEKTCEDEVFNQELSMDDLDAAAGGHAIEATIDGAVLLDSEDAVTSNRFSDGTRQIYGSQTYGKILD